MKNKSTTETGDADGSAGIAPPTLIGDDPIRVGGRGVPEYLKTREAAKYLRKSVSWLAKRHDIAYVRGVPNIYKRKDLDSWFERNKFEPSIN